MTLEKIQRRETNTKLDSNSWNLLLWKKETVRWSHRGI